MKIGYYSDMPLHDHLAFIKLLILYDGLEAMSNFKLKVKSIIKENNHA